MQPEQIASSKDKQIVWRQKLIEMEHIRDGMGKGLDPHIKETHGSIYSRQIRGCKTFTESMVSFLIRRMNLKMVAKRRMQYMTR